MISNDLQHTHSPTGSPILDFQSEDALLDSVFVLLDQLRFAALAAAMIDLQALCSQVYRRPDIFATQPLGDFPFLLQEIDFAPIINSADEMQASLSQPQLLSQLLDFSLCQFATFDATAGLFHRQSRQCWRCVVFIPKEKLPTLALKRLDRSEVIAIPKTVCPKMIDAFDDGVALRLAGRNEQQLNPQKQRQPHKMAKNSWLFAQSGEGCVIVELQKVGQSQDPTSLHEMAGERHCGFVSATALAKRLGVEVNRVKDEELVATRDPARRPITSIIGAVARQSGRGIEGRSRPDRLACQQTSPLEPTIDGRDGWQPPDETMNAQLLTDRSCADQPDRCALQLFAQPQNEFDHARFVLLRVVLGSFGVTIERLPTLLRKAMLPLEEPGARARNALENLSRRYGFVKELEGQTAVVNFVSIFLFHKTEKSRYERERKSSIYDILSERVHDVVRLLPN